MGINEVVGIKEVFLSRIIDFNSLFFLIKSVCLSLKGKTF